MALRDWKPKQIAISSLYLDSKNPRLGATATKLSQDEIIRFLFEHEKAVAVAESIARRGFFPTESLVVVREDGRYVVVEGNRRLAAVKALREPEILHGTASRKIRALADRADQAGLATLPVMLAPNRRETDALVAARHGGTAVEAWDAEKRAAFILEKFDEGYEDAELTADLGFSTDQVEDARLVYALGRIVRGLELPGEAWEKLRGPRLGILSTLKRVVEFPSGQKHLRVKPDRNLGLVGDGDPEDFRRALGELVKDLVLGDESSRTLNTDDETDDYFVRRNPAARVRSRPKSGWVPEDIYPDPEEEEPPPPPTKKPRTPRQSKNVLPTSLKARHGSVRVVRMRDELTKLRRDKFPNAGAVGLRVFFELVIVDYLTRKNLLDPLKVRLANGGKYPHDVPPMQDLLQAVRELADRELDKSEAREVKKALSYDKGARFNISDLHSFVHYGASLPTDSDLEQFWVRTEPLFRLMLEAD